MTVPDRATKNHEPDLADTSADDDLDWFEDVPDEDVGSVLSLDELDDRLGV